MSIANLKISFFDKFKLYILFIALINPVVKAELDPMPVAAGKSLKWTKSNFSLILKYLYKFLIVGCFILLILFTSSL